MVFVFFFFQAEDGIRDVAVTGVQTCALPISLVNVAPFTKVPLLPSLMSPAFPFPGHQATRPEGAGVQVCADAVPAKIIVRERTTVPRRTNSKNPVDAFICTTFGRSGLLLTCISIAESIYTRAVIRNFCFDST